MRSSCMTSSTAYASSSIPKASNENQRGTQRLCQRRVKCAMSPLIFHENRTATNFSLPPIFRCSPPPFASTQTLSQKPMGHYGYYGITGNSSALSRFRDGVTRIWRRWLSRQHRDGEIAWAHSSRFLERYPLPPAVAIHSMYRRVAPA